MHLNTLFDPASAAIVVGGTVLGTVLRAGFHDLGITGCALVCLRRRKFSAARARADLARQVQEIRSDGLLRAEPAHVGDSELDEATDALLERRSITALLERHETHKQRRLAAVRTASGTLAQAAELAPVFGLAGTLVSLSQLPAGGVQQGAFASAIAMAVLTTLYGLLLANLLLAPLARVIDRHAQAEEAERQKVIDWLAYQVGPVCRETDRGHPERREAA
ncbi:MAG: MotA/TolQ/ExbB proton channel family protein [Sphingomonadales bacterium]|nr:MotA/TolQ/ExbB proton channel family protein [Sphingomonadales bacterium]MDE2569023.1 MotA/TolQ/ExbB proton channel family protein [Sphingomonadales bacterium]